MKLLGKCSGIMFLCLLVTACMSAKGDTQAEKKTFIENMRSQTLAELYKEVPEARSRMAKMVGYAVFSSINTNLFLFSSASGYGVAVDNGTGKKTYMKMYQLGVGPGLGIKDYRIVFMFRNRQTFDQFVNSGWEFGGHADAAAKSGDEKGGAVGGQVSVDTDIVIYTLTEAGVALQATVAGTKYWADDTLNSRKKQTNKRGTGS